MQAEPTVDVPLTLTDLLISKQVFNTTLNVWYQTENPSFKQSLRQRQLADLERKVSDVLIDLSGGGADGSA